MESGAIPAGLLEAFWAYERALGGNDVPALAHAFVAGPLTLRAENTTVLVGSGHIEDYRRGRTPPPRRRVDRLHLRPLAADVVLAVAETTRDGGGTGTQTQVWRSGPSGWQVEAAHVATAPPAPAPGPVDDAAIWRETQRPLRGSTGVGPLAGVRLAVKDLFAVAGQRTGAGNPTWLAQAAVADADAGAVEILAAAGAELSGLAQTDELAFSLAGANAHYGTPPNAAVPGGLPGGSSSGPAAAVAAGLADLGLGTDTAGSIRVPASYCGLWGLRPTHGVVPASGVVGLAPSFDAVGLLAASPLVLAAGADVLLPQAPGTALHTVLVVEELLAPLAPDVRLAFDAALLAVCGRRGLQLRSADRLGDLDAWLGAFRTIQTAEAWRLHGAFVTANPTALAPAVADRFRSGAAVTPQAEQAARVVQAQAVEALAAAVPAGVALALPAASGVAPDALLPADAMEPIRAATLRLTHLASLTGRPALVLPTMRVGAAPMGLCLVGAPGEDRALLETLEIGVSRVDA